jgi:acyl-CoA thioester hydrolase
MDSSGISSTLVRVNYSETDQMGVVYHARYVIWLDIARTEHLRDAGMAYRSVEEAGYRLAVGELTLRFRQPARYDDLIRVRCWVREVASRRVTFGYAVEDAESGRLLATATTAMMSLDAGMAPARLPDAVRRLLRAVPDPVRIH